MWLISGLVYLLLTTGFMHNADVLHDFHVSKCEVNFNIKEKALQVSLHVFLDDLENALALYGAENLNLCTSKEDPKAELYLLRYLQNHFKVKGDDFPYEINFVGKEISEDLAAVWCYFEFLEFFPQNSIEIDNSVLMDLFDDQKNIVSLEINRGKKDYFLLQQGETVAKMELE